MVIEGLFTSTLLTLLLLPALYEWIFEKERPKRVEAGRCQVGETPLEATQKPGVLLSLERCGENHAGRRISIWKELFYQVF